MKQLKTESILGNARVFVACLLSFAILITPIAAVAGSRSINARVATPTENKKTNAASLAVELPPAPVPEPAPPFAAVITASMTDNRPAPDPASAAPGDAINYTVTIQNTGNADATGVQFNDDLDLHTAYIAGSGLLAMADSYNTIGNVQISIPDGATDLLNNDRDLSAGNNNSMTATAQTVSSAQCAACNNVTINANGSFTYDPPLGFTGTDSFSYISHNAANTRTAMATVQVTVSGKLWFINNNTGACTSNCDGRLSHPFQTLAAFQAANDGGAGHPGAGDFIFLFENTAATAYVGPVTLLNNQKFIGQDATAGLISLTGFTQPSGTNLLPTMDAANGNIVNITSGANAIQIGNGNSNTLRGFTVGTTTGAKIISTGATFGTLTIGDNTLPDVTLNGGGQALNLTSGAFAATTGFVSVASTSSSTQGINLSGITGTASFGSTSISGATTQGILIGTTTANINFGNTSTTGGTDGISFQNNSSGTRTFGTLSATAGTGFAFNHAVGGGNVTVNNLATLTSNAGNTIDIQNQAVSTTINFAGGATLTKTAGGTGINLVNEAGTLTFGGTLTIGTSGARFPATAITITNGTAASIVNLGTLSVFTNSFAGIASTDDDGTINSTAGTIDVNAARAIFIDGPAGITTLGMALDTVNSSGGTNNINLTDDGGSLTVTNGTLSGATGPSFNVTGGTVSSTFGGGISQANAVALVNVSGGHSTGTIAFNTGTLSATNGTGLQFTNADGTYNFNGTTTLNGGNAAVDILDDSAGSFTFAAGAAITSPTGIAFNVDGQLTTSTANVTYNGSITQANAFAMVVVKNHNTGTISFQNGTLSATNGTGLQFDNADSTTSYNFNTSSGTTTLNGGDAGIDILNGSAGNFTFGRSATPASFVITKAAAGNAFNVDGTGTAVTGNVTFNGNITQSNTGAMVNVLNHGTGTITFQAGALSATNGTGLQFTNADGAYNFNVSSGTTTLNGGGAGDTGIDVLNGSAGTFAFGGTTITNPTGVALNVDGSTTAVTGGITISGTISKTSSGRLIDFNNYDTATATISGTLTCNTSCGGIEVTNDGTSSGIVTFSGGTKTLSTTTNTAVNLDNNDSGTINFTGGGLDIDTSSGTGFSATNGGTVNVGTGGNPNTIDKTSGAGTALTVTDTTIGTGITFQSISTNGGTNGIVLTNTGATAGLTVSGNGGSCTSIATCTGGTIQNTTGHGINLNNTINFSIDQMFISATANSGINGTLVTNFTFTDGKIDNSGTALGTGNSNIGLNKGAYAPTIGTEKNVTGTVAITGNTLTNAYYHGIDIYQFDGTVTNLNISNNVFTSSTSTANSKGDGIRIVGFGSAGTVANYSKGTINANTITNFPSDAGIFFTAGNSTSAGAPAGTYGTDTSTNAIQITNNVISGQSAANKMGTQGINAGLTGRGTGFFRITGNSITHVTGIGINSQASGLTTWNGIVLANTINANNTVSSAGIGGGTTNSFSTSDTPTYNIKIGDGTVGNRNIISNTNGNGILLNAISATGKLNARILTNNVSTPTSASGTTYGIRVAAGNPSSIDDAVCLEISGNTTAGDNDGFGTIAPGIGLRKQGTTSTTNDFGIVGMAATSTPNVENYVNGLNPGSASGSFGVGGTALISATSGFSNCSMPAVLASNSFGPKPSDNYASIFNSGSSTNAQAELAAIFADTGWAKPAPSVSDRLQQSSVSAEAIVIAKNDRPAASAVIARLHQSSVTGEATVIAKNDAVINRLRQSAVRAEATMIAKNDRPAAPVTLSSWVGKVTRPLAQLARSVDSLVTPSAYAESAAKSEAKAQKSDVRLNHARRSGKASTASTTLMPFAPCGAITTTHICVDVGTLKPGDSVQISFSASVNNPPNLSLLAPPRVTTQGSVTYNEGGPATTDDPDAGGGADATVTPIDLFNTSTSVISSLEPADTGVAVTFTATVNETPAQGTADPTGTVQFKDGATPLTCTEGGVNGIRPLSGGTAACTTSALTQGAHTINADYSGDGNFDPSTGNVTQNINACVTNPVVTSADDHNDGTCDADCTLREAIATTCNNNTITFNIAGAGPHTITLTMGELAVTRNTTINNNSGESVTVTGNNASRVFNINSGKTVAIVGLTISGGAAANGAGILNDGTLTVVNSTLTANNATSDGAGIHQTAAATSLTLINTTISGNRANGFGGGVDVLGGTATIINATISDNHGDNDGIGGGGAGGLRRQGGTVTLKNTIVAGNFLGSSTAVLNDIDGAVDAASSNNLIGDGTNMTGITHGTNGNQVGTGASPIDPQIFLLTNNGGLTKTQALSPLSPALEAGSNANLPVDTFDLDGDANMAETLPVDQRGLTYLRVADSDDANTTQTVDIGAFELHPTIQDIANQTTPEDVPLMINFNLGDDTGSLINTVTATSSNTALVASDLAHLTITGSGGSRTLTITPNTDANSPTNGGATTITVTVLATNGQSTFDVYDLTVTEVNDNPDAVNDSLSAVDEDSGQFAVPFATLLGNDTKGPNENGQTITVTGVSNFVGGTATLDTPNSQVLFTPNANFNGTASFDYTITDNGTTNAVLDAKSDTATASFTVNAINDPPSFTKGANPTVNEDAGAQTIVGWATSISQGAGGETGQTPLTFNITPTGTTGNISFASGPSINSTTGTLTYTTNADTNGTATFDVTLSDSGPTGGSNVNTSAAQTFTITVNAVNDAPTFLLAGNPAAVNEDAGAQTVNGFANSFQPGPVTATDEGTQTLVSYTLTLTGSTGGLTFSSGPSIDTVTGNLTYTPAANANGTATYNVVATDSGPSGGSNVNQSAPVSFTITVNAQNDDPTLTTNVPLAVVNGGTGTIDNTRLKVDDIDNAAGQIAFTIGTAPTNGILKNGALVLSAGSMFTQADINANQITYQHTNLASIVDSFTFTFTDGIVAPIGPTTFNITTGCGNSITVTSTADNGNGTLRQAIAALCDGGTIGFNIAGGGPDTITLTTGELVIDKNLTINGPTAKSLIISGNNASRVFKVDPGKNATLTSLTIRNGSAAFGGGIYNQGTLTIIASTINANASANGADNGAGNGANGGDGGGIYNSGTLNVINSTISGNNAGNGGNATGGMGVGVGGNGGNGGGIYNSGTLLLINDSISQNRAGRNGLNTNGDDTNVDLGNPGQGGGVFTTTTTAVLRNTIIAGNLTTFFSHNVGAPGTNAQDNDSDVGGTVDSSSSFNLIGVFSGFSGISPGTNGNQGGDPLFGPLQNNGGPTATYLPAQFSPAIDMGSNALATDQNNVALTTDQRGTGFPRILNGTVDIGAVETTPPPPPPPSADLGVTKLANVSESLADRDIIYTITVINSGPDAAATVALNDVLPGNLTFVSLSSPAGWSCTTPSAGSGGTVNCTNPSVPSGANAVFTLTVHIPSGTPGGTSYHNVATISSATADPNNLNNSYPADTDVVACLANSVVTSNADSGAGTLRQAIAEVCDGGTISFNPGLVSPITLTTSELVINKNLTITGPGANLLTVMRSTAGGTPNFRIFNIGSGMTVNISGLTINNGNLSASDGGGVFNQGALTLTASAITGSSAGGHGGGVGNATGATLTIFDSTISGNTSGGGAGIYNAATLTLFNSTISGNTGDGLSNGTGAVANLTNDTFSNNSVQGITSNPGATTNIRNTIVVNTPGAFGDVQGAFVSQGNNLIGKSDGSSGLTNGVNNDKVGTIASPLAALLAVLGNYGGPTQTHALLPGSPAIDAANNCVTDVAHCGDANIPQLTNDQRNSTRQVGSFVDIGAFESRGFTVAATSGTPQSTIVNTAFAAPLLATVSSAFGEPVSGGQITFTAPGAGASATFTGGVTTINMALNASGQGSASATANAIVGGYNVTATGVGVSGSAAFSLTNQKANQTINFAAIPNKTFGDADFMVSPTATSGLPVSLAASGQCTVTSPSPGTVHITGAGSCTITASQGGNGTYNPAPDVQQSFTINKANQTINFAAIPNKTFGDADFGVSPTATSGLPVSLAASGQCTVTTPSPGTVHITGAGSCTITASQAGNANFNAAPNVQQSFTIAKAASSTALSSSVNPSEFGESVTFTATVSSAAGTPTGTVQFKDGGANLGSPVALNGSGVAQFTTSALTSGTHTITAEYSGDANFLVSTGTLAGGQVVKAQPSLSINDVSITEGNSGTQTLTFTVTLSAASSLTVTANFATANGSATQPSDYLSTNGTLTFNPGDTSKPVSVTINGDVGFEADETFTVNLTSPVNATIADNQGTGTIQNDDVLGGIINFANVSYNVNESTGIVTVTVVRTNDATQPVTVDYATNDAGAPTNCATLLTGLASQRCDFTTILGTLKFAANETQKTVDIPINLDAYAEGPETFTVNLSNPTGGAILGVPATTIVTINDSASPTPNAIDDTTNFVRQQYRDFLNREADPAGLAFWVNNIDKCNDPLQRPAGQTLAQCIEVQRIVTSAAFFLSIEFKQTGGLVREFYVAALNRPATNNMPNYIEFMRDTQAIQRGVIVGQGNWQQVLDANRAAFMNEFVLRAEFVGLYPTTDTPTQYVDKLYLHANVVPGNAQERLDAIAEFGGAATAANAGARGRALLRITQNAAFQAREYARTFVHIEYFGYLRRNPNDLPDGNFDGYNFWVNKLNQFNGDFLQAEMVKAFLISLEYRSRFGP